MSERPNRYRETFDYDHNFHAGNVGDVFKHCVLRAWVEGLQAGGPLHVVDTHAGAGVFNLRAQGEWTEGIGRLDAKSAKDAPALVRDYLQAAGSRRELGRGGLYPGSPAFVRSLLRVEERLTVFELRDEVREKLVAHYAADSQVSVCGGDGLSGLVELAKKAGKARIAAFIDPPYVAKSEWTTVVQQSLAAKAACPGLAVCIWYPIKSLSRPQTMRAELRKAGHRGACVELISTPLHLKRKRLNGSGLLFIDPPAGLLAKVGEAVPWLGEVLATDGEWTVAAISWEECGPHPPTP